MFFIYKISYFKNDKLEILSPACGGDKREGMPQNYAAKLLIKKIEGYYSSD